MTTRSHLASGDSKDSDDCRYTVAYTNSPSGICDPFGIDDSDNDPTEAKHSSYNQVKLTLTQLSFEVQ